MNGRIFTPFRIGSFVIHPEDAPLASAEGIPLIMGKKGAFGSGEHETTRSCLEQLERLSDLKGARVLDLGSGTGILAIAAVKLGAKSVVALDIDPRAAVSCARNIGLNNVAGRVGTVCGELPCIKGESFDLVIANIYADVLTRVAEELVIMTRHGGKILLSGIPTVDDSGVHGRFLRNGCRTVSTVFLDDYITFLLEKD